MRCLQVGFGLCQVSPEHGQVGMAHELLQAVDVAASPQAEQSEASAEAVQARLVVKAGPQGPTAHHLPQAGVGQPAAGLGRPQRVARPGVGPQAQVAHQFAPGLRA